LVDYFFLVDLLAGFALVVEVVVSLPGLNGGFFVLLAGSFFGLSSAWLRAEAATDFTFFGVLGSLNSSDALVATFFEVFSFFAIVVEVYSLKN
jgi:hypothetical protein